MTEAQVWPAGGQRASPLLLVGLPFMQRLDFLSARALTMQRMHDVRVWARFAHTRLLLPVCVPVCPARPSACVPDCLSPLALWVRDHLWSLGRLRTCNAADCSRAGPIMERLGVVKMTAGTPAGLCH